MPARQRVEHRGRGFARGDDEQATGVKTGVSDGIRERRVEQDTGIGRGQRRANDGVEILAETLKRCAQCTFFGSDQAERPVSRSNFRNSVLTT